MSSRHNIIRHGTLKDVINILEGEADVSHDELIAAVLNIASKAVAQKEGDAPDDKHNWECIEVGNWHSEYKCSRCGAVCIEEPDGSFRKPKDGCAGDKNDND